MGNGLISLPFPLLCGGGGKSKWNLAYPVVTTSSKKKKASHYQMGDRRSRTKRDALKHIYTYINLRRKFHPKWNSLKLSEGSQWIALG